MLVRQEEVACRYVISLSNLCWLHKLIITHRAPSNPHVFMSSIDTSGIYEQQMKNDDTFPLIQTLATAWGKGITYIYRHRGDGELAGS